MRNAFSWVKQILGGGGGKASRVLALVNPPVVRDQSPLVRFAVAGGTVAGIIAAAVVGAAAIAALLMALGAIYFLATQVLGLKFNVDPNAFYQSVQRQAAAAYGAN